LAYHSRVPHNQQSPEATMNDIMHIQSISQIHRFLGLRPPKHPLISVMRLQEEETNVAFNETRIVIDLYSIAIKSGSSGAFSYGRNSYDFDEGTVVFLSPGQTVRFGENYALPLGAGAWTVVFHPDLIRQSELGQRMDGYSFFDYDINEALHISEDERQILHEIVNNIEREYMQNLDRHSQDLVISNIKLLLDYCARYFDRQFYTRTNMNKDIVAQFERLLKDYYSSGRHMDQGIPSVAYCGEALGLSPKYLSDLLRKETGRNALEHIHFFVIEKAKLNLLNSEQTISQIAFGLGFEYSQHFSRLFKTKTGMSPREYRSLN
ncbi:MAG: helix-turn-helix domain-containing protein, partial [Chloroflexota bacterium]